MERIPEGGVKVQTRRDSFLESVLNTLVGFFVNYFAGFLIIPLVFGFTVTAGENFKVTFIYTVLSILRGYGLRRFFNWRHAMAKKTLTK